MLVLAKISFVCLLSFFVFYACPSKCIAAELTKSFLHIKAGLPAVVKEVTITEVNAEKAVDETAEEVLAFIRRKKLPLAGPRFIHYKKEPTSWVGSLIEVGYPVKEPLVTKEDPFYPITTLSGHFLKVLHIGPYSEEEKTYAKALDYLGSKNKKMSGLPWELLLNFSKNTPPEKLRTLIYIPYEDDLPEKEKKVSSKKPSKAKQSTPAKK